MRFSQAEYNVLLARGLKRQEQSALGSIADEAELHEQILAYCRSRGWLACHGSMAHHTKRTLGEPDFQIFMDNHRAMLVECKRPDGKLTMEQLGFQAQAQKLGWTVYVVHSMEEFLNAVKEVRA